MPLKQFPPELQTRPRWMSHRDWLDHLEEVKAGERRIARFSTWRAPKPEPRLKIVRD